MNTSRRNRGAPLRRQEHDFYFVFSFNFRSLAALGFTLPLRLSCILSSSCAHCVVCFSYIFIQRACALSREMDKREAKEHQTKRLTKFTNQTNRKCFEMLKKTSANLARSKAADRMANKYNYIQMRSRTKGFTLHIWLRAIYTDSPGAVFFLSVENLV